MHIHKYLGLFFLQNHQNMFFILSLKLGQIENKSKQKADSIKCIFLGAQVIISMKNWEPEDKKANKRGRQRWWEAEIVTTKKKWEIL